MARVVRGCEVAGMHVGGGGREDDGVGRFHCHGGGATERSMHLL